MRFEWPLVLVAIVLVPIAFAAYVLVERRRARYAIRFPNLEVLASVVAEQPPRRGVPRVHRAVAVGDEDAEGQLAQQRGRKRVEARGGARAVVVGRGDGHANEGVDERPPRPS
jgi:hypothetical protein